MTFDEHSEKAQKIMGHVEMFVKFIVITHGVSPKDPAHDIARRFLNEIEEFEAVGE